jgi:hypothetical protein
VLRSLLDTAVAPVPLTGRITATTETRAAFTHFVRLRAQGGAERRAGSGPSSGPGRRRFSICEIGRGGRAEALWAATINSASVIGDIDTQTGLLRRKELDQRLTAAS